MWERAQRAVIVYLYFYLCAINDGGRRGSNANAVPPTALDSNEKRKKKLNVFIVMLHVVTTTKLCNKNYLIYFFNYLLKN